MAIDGQIGPTVCGINVAKVEHGRTVKVTAKSIAVLGPGSDLQQPKSRFWYSHVS